MDFQTETDTPCDCRLVAKTYGRRAKNIETKQLYYARLFPVSDMGILCILNRKNLKALLFPPELLQNLQSKTKSYGTKIFAGSVTQFWSPSQQTRPATGYFHTLRYLSNHRSFLVCKSSSGRFTSAGQFNNTKTTLT